MAINEIRRQKYTYARKMGFDSTTARKMRNWSWERVQATVASPPDRKQSHATDHRQMLGDHIQEGRTKTKDVGLNEERRKKYQYLKEQGYSAKEAQKMRNWGWERIEGRGISDKATVGKDLSPPRKLLNWERWSNEKDPQEFPQFMDDWARKINKREGQDETDSFGWAIIYFMYVEGMTLEEALPQIDLPYRNK